MSFAKNINRICAERGTNLTTVVKAVKNGSSSFTTAINKGALPKESEMVEMARLLNCSVKDFFCEEQNLELENKPYNEDELDILRIFRSLSRKEKHAFMTMVYDFEKSTEF